MKLNRRKLFAAGVGAAVAGPQMARDAVQGLPPTPYYGGNEAELGAKSANEKEWTLQQLAKARRIAAGDILPEDESYPTEGLACPFEPLRSVSQSAKRLMRDRRNRQWHRNRMMENARKALDEFDKFGVMRSLF